MFNPHRLFVMTANIRGKACYILDLRDKCDLIKSPQLNYGGSMF